MKLSEFDYELPKELIAQYPLLEREDARLMVVNRETEKITHGVFRDIEQYVFRQDLLVVNDTRVLPSRLCAFRASGGKVEILLLERKSGSTFYALIKPARLKVGETISFNNNGVCCRITAKNEVTFNVENTEKIYAHGTMPLPPYIKRKPVTLDDQYYQTVYAAHDGSVAAPTAGLHFTKDLLGSLSNEGVDIAYVTLHIGYATFKPVKSEVIDLHEMGYESFSIPLETQRLLARTRASTGRIIAVGTTSCRALEAYASGIKEGRTNLFIYPGYSFKMIDCLLTNFHLPRTTLFMLASAFAGVALIKKAYKEAIENKYRFYSYGDAMLII